MSFRAAYLLIAFAGAAECAPSPLFARGYAVIPTPQRVSLTAPDLEFGPSWKLEIAGTIDEGSRILLSELPFAKSGTAVRLRLEIREHSVKPGESLDRDRNAIAAQAYRIQIKPGVVSITANAAPGVFYGLETLTQLLKPAAGKLWLPEGEITDWPDLQMRNIYWDDAHHLDRPEALKKAIRQAAFFKVNGFVVKLEGHFEFRHAPAVIEPYALTPTEFQELTDYAARYHVQLIPYLDGPAHIAFILKHPEYAKLRSFPESNYEMCAVNPDAYALLEGMFQDLLDANKGTDYIYLSTDEAYYIGWANNAHCDEKTTADRLGSRGKLLAEFLSKAGGYLHDRGRKVVFWGEYPLKPDDIPSLPPFLINGEVYTPEFDRPFRARGIRQMLYTATQGDERIFPAYSVLPESRHLHATAKEPPERAREVYEKISFDQSRGVADIEGAFVAGWADAGQHPEDFWLGYASGMSAAWHPGATDPAEIIAAFFPLFYGWGSNGMGRAYQLLSYQAQFWTDSWDQVESKSRKPIWGSSERIFTPPHAAKDQSISLPLAPEDDLKHDPAWSTTNARRLALAAESLRENDELLAILQSQLLRVDHNRYNVEVFLSNALLCRQNLDLLLTFGRIDRLLSSSSPADIDRALELLRTARDERNRMLAGLTETWEKSWYPKVAEANGRRFLHEVDDVKDHFPDRTVDLSYLVLRQLQLPIADWAAKTLAARNHYAAAHNLPTTKYFLDWTDLKTTKRIVTTAPTIE